MGGVLQCFPYFKTQKRGSLNCRQVVQVSGKKEEHIPFEKKLCSNFGPQLSKGGWFLNIAHSSAIAA